MATPIKFLAIMAGMVGLVCYGQPASPSAEFPAPAAIRETILRANDYFLSNDTLQTNGWARGAYYTGNMLAYQVLGVERYLQSATDWATRNAWQPGIKGATNADGEVCGQTYIDLYRIDPQPIRIAAIKSGIDGRVASAAAVQDWWWIDAFFMAGPVFARFGNLYATNSYFDKMWSMYDDMKTRRALFAWTYGLWYRDADAQAATTKNGQKQIWGRGNGWVMAALARVLEQMPLSHPHRADFIAMLQTMAAALKPLQGIDGMWRSSLLDAAEFPNPETSCTALFTYALASGIRNGYLDAANFQPVVARAWNGMVTNALQADGLVGFVQAQGRFPAAAASDSTFDFGVGAFLLAGSEVLRLVGGAPTAPLIISQPASQAVPPGATVRFTNTVIGAPPLRYQWLKDGVRLSGATNAFLTLGSVQTNQTGNYQLIATNAMGAVTSAVANLTVLTLPIALNTTNWLWTIGGPVPWTAEVGVAHDGISALQSGKITDNQTSWVQTALSGPVTLTFWWKVSSETNKDYLRFFVNGTERMRISGEVDWQLQSVNLAAGAQVLRWAYTKNGTAAKGQDRGWLDQAGITCNYALAPASREHGFGAETGSVSVATSNTLCAWSVLNSNSWITIFSGSGGAGEGTVQYSVDANPTPFARTGALSIAEQPFTISQAGAPCTFTLFPTEALHGFGYETGFVAITTVPGCAWAASTTNDWITLNSSSNGIGQGSVGYQIAANPTALLRTGAVIIANQAFVLSQMGAPCLFELFPSSRLHGPRNETGLVTVITIPGCDWTVHNSNDWVTISSRADGTGQGFFLYTVASNATPVARVGFLELAGQSFAITNLGNVALSCPLDKVVECASQWSFDEPAVATGCPDTNVLLRIVSTLTNLSICGHTFTATRTWEGLDTCSNRTTCSQTVSVVDTTPPMLSCAPDKTVELGNAWSFDPPIASDSCDGDATSIREVNTVAETNGFCGNTFTATRTWEAMDGCSNRVRCSQKVTVADTLPPLLTCAGVKGVVCGADWSFDEPVAFDLADGANVNITILSTITNGNCGQTFAATRAWMAADQCGNASTCSQTVTNVQIVISGMIAYPSSSLSNRPLASVWVNLSGDATQRIQTASDGSYRFTVNAGGSFSVTPELPDSDPGAHGVSTVDLSLIRRHILNVGKLDSPYKLLAADVNASQSVTTVDLFRIRQMILSLTDTLPAGVWRAIPSDYLFPDAQNPWNAPASRHYDNLLENRSSQDFFAIKLGDVNNSWTPGP